MSPSKPIVLSQQDLDLITKKKEDDLKKDSVEGSKTPLDVNDLLDTQVLSNGRYIQ